MAYEDILHEIDLTQFFLQYLSDKKRIGEELLTNCPFHSDTHESFSANLTTGLWRCHAAGCPQQAGGNLIQFYSAIKKIPEGEAYRVLKELYKAEPTNLAVKSKELRALDELADANHERLKRNASAMKFLKQECGYTKPTIDLYKLGYDGVAYWIPIYEDDVLVNVRKYNPYASIKIKGIAGHNQARLFPLARMHKETIFIMEGEKDCILANQLGINAVTVTAGAGTFNAAWITLFQDKHVNICYDIDEAGKKGALKVAETLAGITKSVRILELPITTPINGDFTDYIIKHGHTMQDLKTLVLDTEPYESTKEQKVIIEDTIHNVEVAEASQEKFYYKRVRMQGIVVGKDLAPYLVPKRLQISCVMGMKACPYCGIGLKGGSFETVFNEESPDILRLINCTDLQQERAIRERLDVHGNCKQYGYKVLEAQNIEEIKIIPEIKYSSNVKEYVVRTGYYLGHGCKTNQSYVLTGITIPHPQTQYSTHILYQIKEADLTIEQFRLDELIIEKLKVFQVFQI